MADFQHLRNQEQGLAQYLLLFQGREDCFARQWVDREAYSQGYVPVRRALQAQDVRDHLQGVGSRVKSDVKIFTNTPLIPVGAACW